MASRHSCRTQRGAFTLVELLVVLGVIGVLVGILVPVVSGARERAAEVACASNLRQLATALIGYASQHKGMFPANSGASGEFWYLERTLGPHLTAAERVGRAGAVPAGATIEAGLAGGVFRCSADLDDAVRSYSMNFYASGDVSPAARAVLDAPSPPGRLFRFGSGGESARLLLLVESWSELPIGGTSPTVHVAQAVVGFRGRPGERFGGGRGIGWRTPPDATPGRFPDRDTQIAFSRHGRSSRVEDPRGRANFAFADGHVEMLRHDELIVADRASSFRAMWSPIDREVESR